MVAVEKAVINNSDGLRPAAVPSNLPRMCTVNSQPQVLVYNRINKAGSSTMIALIQLLRKKNNFTVIRPTGFYNPNAARDCISKALLQGNARSLVVEHFNYPSYHVDQRVAYINVVRQPFDRAVSNYCYARYGPRSVASMEEYIRRFGNKTFDECVATPVVERHCFSDSSGSYSDVFCGPEDGGCVNLSLDEQMSLALENMKEHYVVGLTEQFAATTELLAARFPSFFKGAPELYATMKSVRVTQNRSAGSRKCKSTNPTSKQVLMTQNRKLQIDQTFYDVAASHFWGCHKALVS